MSSEYDSSYEYNPFDPRNWTLFCLVNVVTCGFLLVDWLIGLLRLLNPISRSYLSGLFKHEIFFLFILPIITISVIASFSLFLNRDVDGIPFFFAIIIKRLLYLGYNQFSLIGKIAQTICDVSFSIVIIYVFVFIIVFEM